VSQYDRVAQEAAGVVIRRYSTSFRLASRLLASDVRTRVQNIYALVRVADEIVDGTSEAAGLGKLAAGQALNALETETLLAMECGFSANLVVHAFAVTAREVGIDNDLVTPFFASMRMDLTETEHDEHSFERYVHGSAEVVGLMCLRAFVHNERVDDVARLETGARALGAAFQKINFLRDLASDFEKLGRSYFPGVRVDHFSEADKLRVLDDIAADLRVSASAIRGLPRSSRRAVALAQSLFSELARRLRATPAAELRGRRVRVPGRVKARIALEVAAGRLPS
jgi:phytoene/squalene synthetase